MDQEGHVCKEATKPYDAYHDQAGYSEQNPEDWVEQTIAAIKEITADSTIEKQDIKGMSFSGQMHGLVLLDKENKPLRQAILWNDTRTTEECRDIEATLGSRLIEVAKNKALEGFTLPKILWVKKHEPEVYAKAETFVLPKDYLRYRLTGEINMDYSDAAGTLLLDVEQKVWSEEICDALSVPVSLCPPLVESVDCVGKVLPEIAEAAGLTEQTKVFAGGADNACGAIGAGILSPGNSLCSIGTSGVLLSYHEKSEKDVKGELHYFNHGKPDAWYVMGVTLAAGDSLSWFKKTFAKEKSFDELLEGVNGTEIGAKGLLFTPYIMGERTPYPDPNIRASFIGMDASHELRHFARSVMEGITFSLRDSLEIARNTGKKIDQIVSIGGGAKNEAWLQMQADIFGAKIVKLKSEQGPALGAAMLAAVGCGLFDSLEACAEVFIQVEKEYTPVSDHVDKYNELYSVYQKVYAQTKELNESLKQFR